MIKKSFTLVELLVSIVIIGILIVLMFKIYAEILNVSTRVENEKILNNELLFVTETIQNLVDRYDLDYSQYYDGSISKLKDVYGLTGVLYLQGDNSKIRIYSTGNCLDTTDPELIKQNDCWIMMQKDGEKIDLTDKNRVYVSKMYFKIMPYEDVSLYNIPFDDIYHNGFGIFVHMYIKKYKTYWPYRVDINYQSFFNLRTY